MFGNILQSDECWLLDGRLCTVALRMNRQSKNAQRLAGVRKTVSINDAIAAMGKRVPAAADAQKDFTAHFVLLVRKGAQPSVEGLARLDAVRAQFESFFGAATGGRATISTAVQ